MNFRKFVESAYVTADLYEPEDGGRPAKLQKLNGESNHIHESLVGPPNFLIIGAQKAGTMAALKNLNKHPQIFLPSNELHFFDLGWNSKDATWYRSHFQRLPPSKIVCGEKTPEYIYVDACAPRIYEVCPKAKFILFLREPIARAFSSWNMNSCKSRESATFEEGVVRNLNNLDEVRSYGTAEFHYVQRGFYMDQIERFMKVFPSRDHLHIVIAERIRTHPKEEYNKIFAFLGVESMTFVAEDEHMGSYRDVISPKMMSKLSKIYAPHNERLFKFLGYRIPEWETMSITPVLPEANASAKKGAVVSAATSATAVSRSVSSGLSNMALSSSGDFARMGRKHETDKISHHGYHRFYPRFLEGYRQQQHTVVDSSVATAATTACKVTTDATAGAVTVTGAMLEIGIDQSHSLNMWLEYFPNFFIYGMDISVAYEGSRHRVFKVDQANLAEVRSIAQKAIKHPVMFIIDDGSHIPEHQVKCFDYLFRSLLVDGGTYIIEDIETSYWTKNGLYGYDTRYGYHHEKSAVEIFKDLADDVNREFLTEENRKKHESRVGSDISFATRELVSSVTFGQNCVIICRKTVEEQKEFRDRVYRFKKNL